MDPLLRTSASRPSEPTAPASVSRVAEAAAFALDLPEKAEGEALERMTAAGDSPLASDEALVVRFEPVAVSDGRVLAVAHVIRTQMSDLYEEADRRRRSRIKWPLPPAPAEIEVELAAPDAGGGRARISIRGGALGPMLLELRLAGDRVDLRVTASSAQAASALLADRELLERALLAQGLELANLSVDVRRKEG